MNVIQTQARHKMVVYTQAFALDMAAVLFPVAGIMPRRYIGPYYVTMSLITVYIICSEQNIPR